MFATEWSRQNARLAGALLLVATGRIYLSSGGADAMAFTPPRARSLHEATTLLGFTAFAVALSAAIAAAGKRWAGGLASVGLGAIAGLLAICQYNAILGAAIGFVVGALISCNMFIAFLKAVARTFAAVAAGIAAGAAALATQRDLSAGPGAAVLLFMATAVIAAMTVLFRRRAKLSPADWKRRWLGRFGRSSLLLVMVVGLWISLSVDTLRRVHRVSSLRNAVSYTPELPWLWQGCVKVTRLSGRSDLGDSDLSSLRGFKHLEQLDLRNTRVTDEGVSQLDVLPGLSWLVLNDTQVTGSGLGHLAATPSLTQLFLDGTRTDDQGLMQIGRLTKLRGLSLNSTKLTDEGLKHLNALTVLGKLELNDTQIAGDGFPSLASLVWLRTLDLANTQVADSGLEKLPVLPRLTRLRLDGTLVTDEGLQHLKKQPLLRTVEARRTAVTADGAEAFRKTMRQRKTMLHCEVER